MTYKMNKPQFEQVISLPAQQRFDHFISNVSDWQEVWILKSPDGFVTLEDDDGHICIPLWPHREYAIALAKDSWSHCQPESIDLETFIKKWIPGMINDNYWAAVFPTPVQKSIVVPPIVLQEAISRELQNYE